MGCGIINTPINWLLLLSLPLFTLFIPGPLSARKLNGGPCTAGYGIYEATDDLIDMEDNEGCNFLKGEVPFMDDTCVNLLEQGPCQVGEWLIIDDDTEMLKCKLRECQDGAVMYEDRCVSLNQTGICRRTFELIIDEHGEGECECSPGYLYHPSTHQCYVPYTRGPCQTGHIIKMKIDDNTGIADCENNPCPYEKMVPLNNLCLPQEDTSSDAHCFTIGQQSPCKRGSFLLIDPSLSNPYCLAHKPNSIIPRIIKRAAPCQVRYTRSCVRHCDGPSSYPYYGRCGRNYAYFFNYGKPICLRGRCRRASL